MSDSPSAPTADATHPAAFSVSRIFLYLVLLTLATFASLFIQQNFSRVWSPLTNSLFVLTVAFLKASLVLGFFMNLRYEGRWKFALCLPPLILAIITVLSLMPDLGFETYPRVAWEAP